MKDLIDQSRAPQDDALRALRSRVDGLLGQRAALESEAQRKQAMMSAIAAQLGIADAVKDALDQLSEQLFGGLVKTIQEKLSIALQEILEQPISLKVERGFKAGSATMQFHIERAVDRDGEHVSEREDVMKGQGGSVANILSVGLRLFALTTLPEQQHRRVLVLDEPDCWLRPDLVPRLVKIIYNAGKAMGFQVILISHHDPAVFEKYADKIYRFTPGRDGVEVVEVPRTMMVSDADA